MDKGKVNLIKGSGSSTYGLYGLPRWLLFPAERMKSTGTPTAVKSISLTSSGLSGMPVVKSSSQKDVSSLDRHSKQRIASEVAISMRPRLQNQSDGNVGSQRADKSPSIIHPPVTVSSVKTTAIPPHPQKIDRPQFIAPYFQAANSSFNNRGKVSKINPNFSNRKLNFQGGNPGTSKMDRAISAIILERELRSKVTKEDQEFRILFEVFESAKEQFRMQKYCQALSSTLRLTNPFRSLLFLEKFGSKHKIPRVRECTSMLIGKLIDMVPKNTLMSDIYAQRVFPILTRFLRDSREGIRRNAEDCLRKLSTHPDFQLKLSMHVEPKNRHYFQNALKRSSLENPRRSQNNVDDSDLDDRHHLPDPNDWEETGPGTYYFFHNVSKESNHLLAPALIPELTPAVV